MEKKKMRKKESMEKAAALLPKRKLNKSRRVKRLC